MSVFMYVCKYDNFRKPGVESKFILVMRYILREYGSRSYMKVIGSMSRSRKHKRVRSLFLQCKTSIDEFLLKSVKD